MSLHNFNSNTKSWKMYTNTLTSISGDDLLVMPSYGKDLILEVSANNDIFFKKGEITKRFDNLVSDYLDMSFNSLNSQVQYILQEISGNSVKDFITSGISNDLLIKSYDGRDIILEVSGNNEIIFKRGDLSYNLDDLIGGGGGGGSSQNSDYAKYNILDITGKIIFTDNSNIEINNDASFNNVHVSGSLNVAGTVSASNIYTKSQVDASLANIYTKSQVDASLANIYTKSQVDASLANIYTKSQVDASLANIYTKSQVDASLANIYTKSQVDASLANIYTRSQVDASLANIYTKSQVDASLSNVYTKLSVIDSSLVNVYTRGQVDVSFVSKQLFDASLSSIQLSNVYTKSQVDASFVSKQLFEASYNVLAASNGGGGGGYIQNNENISFDILNITDTIIFTDSSNVELYNDASFNNVDVSGSLKVAGSISASNIYTKSQVDVSFVSKQLFDASLSSIQLTNVYTKTEVDVSFVSKQYFEASYNVYSKTEIDASFANVYTKSEVDASFTNLYTKSQVDASFANIYTRSQVDVSFVSKQLFDASINALQTIIINNGSSGSVSLTTTRANIRDISTTNIEVSGNIMPLQNNNSNLGSSLNRWNYIYVNDLSVNTINGQAYSAGGGGGGGGGSSIDLTSVTSNIIPSTTNAYNLGSTSNYWSNAYINNLKVSNRVYQEISGGINDPSWAAVNGYYALAKDAYPALNPLSSGVNAVMNWSFFQTQGNPICNAQDINSICWSPELRIFVAVASSWQPTRIITSINGTIWIPRTTPVNLIMIGVCWSSELLIFVAISYNTNIVLTSINGTTWIQSTAHTGNWTGICWSPQLGLFVAVAPDGVNNIMTSTDGINWLLGTIQDTSWLTNDWLARICWSAELGMFAIVNTGNAAVLTSTNGINWTVRTIDNLSVWGGIDICWSKELGIFVAVGVENKGIISNNGINWRVTEIYVGNDVTRAVVWSPQLKIFIAFSDTGRRLLISNDGINWTKRIITTETYYYASCWSPELGIFVAGGNAGVIYSSLKGRPPTSYNVFDSSFNSIDETGKWSFQNLGVTGTFTNTSDDRLKHNEVVISNGLAIIDSLTPKFYQKTLTMLDASYNGDLSTQAWTYEAGIIAQELLQISDLSFAVSGGDYYQERYNNSRPTNGPSNANYDPSLNIYDISNANYTISNNLITQAYNVNYNSVFVYGLAAIKELHTKVKAQETSISTLQTSMIEQQETSISTLQTSMLEQQATSISSLQTALLEQQATINSLAARIQALEPNSSQ